MKDELAAEREECLRVLDEVLPYVVAFPGRAARVAENCIYDLAARLRSAPSEDIGGELFLQSIADEPVPVIPSDGLPSIDPSLVQNESAFRREPSVCEKCGWPLYACGGHDPDEPAAEPVCSSGPGSTDSSMSADYAELRKQRDEAQERASQWHLTVETMLTIVGLSPALGSIEAVTELRLAWDARITSLEAQIAEARAECEQWRALSERNAAGWHDEVVALAEAREEVERLTRERDGHMHECDECSQIAGKALCYPWFKDDQENFPGATEDNGVCIGEHVPSTIVAELAQAYATRKEMHENERDRYKAALEGERKRCAAIVTEGYQGMATEHRLLLVERATRIGALSPPALDEKELT